MAHTSSEMSEHRGESQFHKLSEGPQVTSRYENVPGLPKNNTKNQKSKKPRILHSTNFTFSQDTGIIQDIE